MVATHIKQIYNVSRKDPPTPSVSLRETESNPHTDPHATIHMVVVDLCE